jgi:rhamnose utilization protein RhaD (predicted bifunctional aldolase and dehydrogenase)
MTARRQSFYRSNLLGSDQRITNTGGGNTSAKLTETDPLTGKPVEVLWVKGSGGDLRTSEAREFFLALPGQADRRCRKSTRAAPTRAQDAIEDAMVELSPLHVQPEPARAVDRHAAAQLRSASMSTTRIPTRPSPSPPRRIREEADARKSTATR